jgi:hypothetical protein
MTTPRSLRSPPTTAVSIVATTTISTPTVAPAYSVVLAAATTNPEVGEIGLVPRGLSAGQIAPLSDLAEQFRDYGLLVLPVPGSRQGCWRRKEQPRC